MKKDITLNDFRKALQDKIYYYLKRLFPQYLTIRNENSDRFILCEIDHKSSIFVLNLEEGKCAQFTENYTNTDCLQKENIVNLTKIDKDDQKHLIALFVHLATAENGYNLWKEVNIELGKMPGWWSFFAALRPLALDLKDVLQHYQQEDLKLFDDNSIKEQLIELAKRIQKYIVEITGLREECQKLRQKNEGLSELVNNGELVNHELSNITMQRKFKQLCDSKKLFQEQLVKFQQENIRLLNQNRLLKKEIDDSDDEKNRLCWMIENLLEQYKHENQCCEKVIASFNNVQQQSGRVLQPQKGQESSASIEEINRQYQQYKRQRRQTTISDNRYRKWDNQREGDSLTGSNDNNQNVKYKFL